MQRLRNIHRRQHARRIAGVNAGLLDVLHDSADHHIFAVRERVHVHFNRIFEKVIDQHRTIVRVLDRLLHVPHNGFLVVGDHHGAPAQHVGRPHHHGISHMLRAFDGFFKRGGHHSRGLRNIEFFQQLVEVLAIFGQINRLRRRADNIHARSLER